MVYRIYFTDMFIRRDAGFSRGTNGLLDRIAAEFGVKRKLIQDIIESTGKHRARFRDIDVRKERENARNKRKSRTRYRQAIAGNRPEQDPAGGQ